jgi:adenylate cyclase class IV
MKYEIEIKSLLESTTRGECLNRLHKTCNELIFLGKESQLNHYFIGGNKSELLEVLKKCFSVENVELLTQMFHSFEKLSIRTREITGNDGFTTVLFIVKASVNSESSENGVSRAEFEESIPLSIDVLDELILSCGYSYQSKWSRIRETFQSDDITICLDKNAGYGYLIEVEKVIENESHAEVVRIQLENFLKQLELTELPQDRLERMFQHYNSNWKDYYGTEKTFTIL